MQLRGFGRRDTEETEMDNRQPAVAGRFYPGDRKGCLQMIEECLPDEAPENLPAHIVAGIVPHAGWVYSGPTAARVFVAIKAQSSPETIVLLSARHSWGAARPAVYGRGSWATPLGEIGVDAELAQAVLEAGQGTLLDAPEAHAGEHSGEVQVPFIQHLFPDSQLLPILIPADDGATAAGNVIARAINSVGREVVVIGTTDLTHYGANYYGFAPAGVGDEALEWTRQNDRQIIDLMLQLQAERVVPESSAHRNACGAGAVAATITAAQGLGATEGVLLEYTTSHDVMPHGPATDFVGYAGIVMGHS
jgi:AmmeMemoRadiSam system protein B